MLDKFLEELVTSEPTFSSLEEKIQYIWEQIIDDGKASINAGVEYQLDAVDSLKKLLTELEVLLKQNEEKD